MSDALKNFSYSAVATAPSPATSGTSLVLSSGDGALFPDPSTDGAYNVTIWPVGVQPTSANAEIARVTARSTDTLTITRAQEGSSARSVVVGDQIALTVTKKSFTDLRAAFLGASSLVYRYTVTGSDKTAIDTGVDTPDAGSNDWTNGDLLEIYLYCRTDDALVVGDVYLTFNNDTGATQYAWARNRTTNAGVTGAETTGAANIDLWISSASNTASVFSVTRVAVPNYAGTVGYKGFEVTDGIGAGSAGSNNWLSWGGVYKSASAITRAAVTSNTGKKMKVGTQLLIYKRLATVL